MSAFTPYFKCRLLKEEVPYTSLILSAFFTLLQPAFFEFLLKTSYLKPILTLFSPLALHFLIAYIMGYERGGIKRYHFACWVLLGFVLMLSFSLLQLMWFKMDRPICAYRSLLGSKGVCCQKNKKSSYHRKVKIFRSFPEQIVIKKEK